VTRHFGRSPRTRGRPHRPDHHDVPLGSIPAYAGQTWGLEACTMQIEVDPRVRGADRGIGWSSARSYGRSPRTRGRLRQRGCVWSAKRSIPAYAGQTQNAFVRRMGREVDPRVRGADDALGDRFWGVVGRSPRTRGRLTALRASSQYAGSIPAYAGQTGNVQHGTGLEKVDPRVRGADGLGGGGRVFGRGRSPRTRGRRQHHRNPRQPPGSIPAYAGQTPGSRRRRFCSGVDPRVRGADISAHACASAHRGRSPRTRGRPKTDNYPKVRSGSIPAYAGQT